MSDADPPHDFTRRLLTDAGIDPGMRVLELGCGHGLVSRMLADRVGPAGFVHSVDRDARAIEVARAAAVDHGLANVAYVEAELGAVEVASESFDAIVGRRVLMYLPDPAAVLRRLAGWLRPGGRVVVQENDTTMVPASLAPLPLHRQVHEWIWRTVEREGADLHMGFHLPGVLERAGLVVEHVRAEAIVQTPGMVHDVARIVAAILPRIEAQQVATAAEIEVETLAARLKQEREAAGSVYVGDMVFGAWARTAG